LKWSIVVAFMVLIASIVPCSATEARSYYRTVMVSYAINEDRSIYLSFEYTLVNAFPGSMIYEITHRIPTSETSGISVTGRGVTYTVDNSENCTEIRVRFTLGGRQEMTYTITGSARGLVSGSGPGYVARLGGISLGDGGFPYENYVIKIRGPPGTVFFTSIPEAEELQTNPPLVRYETRVDAPGVFDGVMVNFYMPTVFYLVRMNTKISGAENDRIADIEVDHTMFADKPWQFSGLCSSNLPLLRMYVDGENNMHGVFGVGELAAGESKTLEIELVYEVDLYNPEIHQENCGTIAGVDNSMLEYLKPDDKWEVSNPAIISKAHELSGSETNTYLILERIAEFVGSGLEYEKQEARRGALWALTNLRGDCSEFTDLLIALARAAGIPARAVYGWGYSEDNLAGHAWAEAYLPGVGWVPVDPTWRNKAGDYLARLDPIHIARCTRGLNSSESLTNLMYSGPSPSTEENARAEILTPADAAVYFVRAAERACEIAGSLVENNRSENMENAYLNALAELSAAKGSVNPTFAISHAKSSLRGSYEIIKELGGVEEETLPWVWVVVATAGGGIVALMAMAYVLRRRR